MSTEDILKTLTVAKLMEICASENISNIPKKIRKDDLIKIMLEQIPTHELSKYLEKKEEKKSDDEMVAVKEEKKNEDNFYREKVILELQKHRIHRILLNELAENLGEKIPTGKGIQLYDGMSDKMLRELEKIFLKPNEKENNRTFTMICSNWLIFKVKEIERIKTGYEIDDNAKVDVIAFDVENLPYIMAECNLNGSIDEHVISETIAKASRLLDVYGKNLAKKYKEAWMRIYFFSNDENASKLLNIIKREGNIDEYGEMHIKRGIFKVDYNLKFHVYSVNEGKFHGLLF
ncbi:hypothetical protein ACNF40_00360 [Cuniculiplasma sp. SKW4]|uniref:hypothetical protein n=1 Tax=Cuniculiplasma sp. SKW4 TaxID=3400171 RepID=UPI003FD34691